MGTVPVPYSPIAGDDATQARVLTWADAAAYLLGSATSGGSRRPVSVLRQTVGQVLATSTSAPLTFDTEDVDYDNGHSTVTNTSRYTAATAGWYLISAAAAFPPNVTGERSCFLRINGVTNVPATAGIGQAVTLAGDGTIVGSTPRLVFLNAGDYVEALAFQDSGAGLTTVVVSQNASCMCVEWRSN